MEENLYVVGYVSMLFIMDSCDEGKSQIYLQRIAESHTHTHTDTPTHTHTHTHTYTHTHVWTDYIDLYPNNNLNHTCAPENISGHFGLLFLRAPYKFQFYFTLLYFIHTHIYTHTHASTHAHTQTHTHTQRHGGFRSNQHDRSIASHIHL